MTNYCEHRHCGLPKLVLLIKMASRNAPAGMSEQEVIEAGFAALRALGVAHDEIMEATLDLILGESGLQN